MKTLNYVVAMKQVPDLQQLRIRDKKPVLTDIPLELGKIDKNALECAVNLKEQHDGEVILVSVGNDDLPETLKDGLACGADRAKFIADNRVDNLQSAQKAELLAKLIEGLDDVSLIFFAEGSADNYSGQVGSRVAEILGYPQVGYASEVKIQGETAIITRALENSYEDIEVALPAVVIVVQDLNKPRLPSVIQILKAGKKPQERIDLADSSYEAAELTVCYENLAPDTDRKMQELSCSSDLIEVLKDLGVLER
ncbi:MAG: electron transfer flavoprotein subunit beta/FixA family protein [Coriobacteriales bacterium]|jgi:electron transfer flavoprotein beta subunit|nr:electron transfer flavoprotein subunit beta/FixA family protein [Coriobacteriales bacterium]